MIEFDADLAFNIQGTVGISERLPRDGSDSGWQTESLVEHRSSEIELRFSIEQAESSGVPDVEMSTYHVPNDETDRHFHTRLKVDLNWDEVATLQKFLTFLLETRGK
jgi:hypothetical protein